MEDIKELYPEIKVGRAKDLTNQTFGDFTALYRTSHIESNSKQAHWVCQCQLCKKYFIKTASILRGGVNRCKCRDDLTGKKLGRWIVLYKTGKTTKNKNPIYHCRCDCGNEKDVDAWTLRSGQSKSCGCLKKEYEVKFAKEYGGKNRLDLTGQRFGKLVALYPIYGKNYNVHTKWHCKCDCGNEVDIDMGNLRQGFSQSCGCSNSREEQKIISLLTKANIPFIYQYRFKDFAIKKFDFFVDNNYIVEYDGQQHFYFKDSGWDTEEHFIRTRKSDLEKNKYCFDHNIPIIRIPYNQDYTIDDLKLGTTRFLLTRQNEQKYYNRKNEA